MRHPSKSIVADSNTPVNPPTLPDEVLATLEAKYHRRAAVASLDRLKQGDIDVLEEARRQLGWPSLLSLAHKYYPLYPQRHAWRRALEKCRHVQLRTATLNIKYLLLAVITQVQYSLKAAFSPRGSSNRLIHHSSNNNSSSNNRLVPIDKFFNPKPGGYQEIVLLRQRRLDWINLSQ